MDRAEEDELYDRVEKLEKEFDTLKKEKKIEELEKELAALKKMKKIIQMHVVRYTRENKYLLEEVNELRKEKNEARKIIDAFLDFETSVMERGCYIADDMRKRAEDFLKE